MAAEEYVRAHCPYVEVVLGQVRINDAKGNNVIILRSWVDAKMWVYQRLVARHALESQLKEARRGIIE